MNFVYLGLLYSSLLCLVVINAQFRFACDENFCSKKVGPCPKLDCPNGEIIKNATQCGCCDVCVISLNEGDPCRNKEYAAIPRQECGAGLQCNEGVCEPSSTKCIRDQEIYDSDQGIGELTTGKSRPKCDYFGFYEPVSCKTGMLCFCVDKNGERIFGTDVSSNKDKIKCDCSLEFNKFPKKLKMGDFLRCLSNGNYDTLQCTSDWCYCMGEDGHVDGRAIRANTSITDLKCYNRKLHAEDDNMLRSKCWRERNALEQQIIEEEARGVSVIGVDLPVCDLDGSYAPVQCKKDSCYCVNSNGLQYEENYKVKRTSKEAKSMNCRCAREKELLRKEQRTDRVTEIFSQYKCGPNGNYLPVQCLKSVCFCVDEHGFQETEAVLRYEHTFLDCYEEEFEKYLE